MFLVHFMDLEFTQKTVCSSCNFATSQHASQRQQFPTDEFLIIKIILIIAKSKFEIQHEILKVHRSNSKIFKTKHQVYKLQRLNKCDRVCWSLGRRKVVRERDTTAKPNFFHVPIEEKLPLLPCGNNCKRTLMIAFKI